MRLWCAPGNKTIRDRSLTTVVFVPVSRSDLPSLGPGGFVYRGEFFADLIYGAYVFGEYQQG